MDVSFPHCKVTNCDLESSTRAFEHKVFRNSVQIPFKVAKCARFAKSQSKCLLNLMSQFVLSILGQPYLLISLFLLDITICDILMTSSRLALPLAIMPCKSKKCLTIISYAYEKQALYSVCYKFISVMVSLSNHNRNQTPFDRLRVIKSIL